MFRLRNTLLMCSLYGLRFWGTNQRNEGTGDDIVCNSVRFRNSCGGSVCGFFVFRAAAAAAAAASVSEEEEGSAAKIGVRVRVKVPLKVYHVPRVQEIELTGMEGVLKQYVGVWKGKRISANLPFKIEFVTEIEGRGRVKLFAHLKEDEFEYLD